MKILSISPAIPAVDAKGFQVQAYYRLIHLARNHEVQVVCFGQGNADNERKRILNNLGIKVCMLPFHPRVALLSVVKALFKSSIPLQCALFSSDVFRDAIENHMRDLSPDLIHATTIRVLPNLDNIDTPLILDLVDSMSLNFKRRSDRSPWWTRPFWMFELNRVSQYERFVVNRARLSFVVSALDKDEIGVNSVHVLPLGIDTERYYPKISAVEPIIVFTGNMSYRPNIEAALWMANKCWPIILNEIKNATFVIAGSRPVKSVQNLTREKSIRVTGRVESMADVLHHSQIAVAPMQSGSGMQFKVLEAMACGIPIISSTLGLGDIKAIPGKEIIVSDSPKQFSESILKLLRSQDLRDFYGKAGFNYIQKNHSWGVINAKFEGMIRAYTTDNHRI